MIMLDVEPLDFGAIVDVDVGFEELPPSYVALLRAEYDRYRADGWHPCLAANFAMSFVTGVEYAERDALRYETWVAMSSRALIAWACEALGIEGG